MAFPQLCPKPFDGSITQDIDYFLSKFEKYASFCQWNDRKKSQALQSMMSDNSAACWLQRQEVDEDTPYDAVITLLRERYSITEAIILNCNLTGEFCSMITVMEGTSCSLPCTVQVMPYDKDMTK